MKDKLTKKLKLLTFTLGASMLFNPITAQAKTQNTQIGVSIAADFYSPGYSVAYYDEKNAKDTSSGAGALYDLNNIKEYTTAPFARFKGIKGTNNYNATIPSTVPEASQIGSSSETKKGTVGDWELNNQWHDSWEFFNSTQNRPYFLFPRNANQADDIDKMEAERVEKYLVRDLNKAMQFVATTSKWNANNEDDRIKDFFKMSAGLANIKETSEFTFNNHTFVGVFENETNKSGRVKIKNKNTGDETDWLYYQINTYKSLMDDSSKAEEYEIRTGAKVDNRLKKLNWNQVVYYGNASYIATGLNAVNQDYQVNSGEADLFERLLADLFNSVIDKLNKLLGAERFERLMLNETDKYGWHGVMPNEWFDIAGVFFWLFQILAWIILLGAVVKLFTSNLISSMNTFGRVQLLEGVRDILLAAFMLAFIYPIFELLANFNELFINIVSNLTYANEELLGSGGIMTGISAGNGLAAALLGVLYFGLNIYFNAVYILRAVSVCLLFGLAPVFTVLYAFGGRFKALTLRFYREVIGNIFIGSFYAIAITFYGLFTLKGGDSFPGALLSFVLLWGFIPMTKLFKNLTGISETDFVSQTAATAQNKIEGAGKKYATDPAKRFGKGASEGVATAGVSVIKGKMEHARRNKEVGELNDNGGNYRLTDYEGGGVKTLAKGVAMKSVGNALGIKPLQQEGMNRLSNMSKPGEIKMKKTGDGKVEESQRGHGYKGTDANEKGNYEHKFNRDDLSTLDGIMETKMSNNGSNVEQKYNAEHVNSQENKAFFDRIEAGTDKNTGIVTDSSLLSQGIEGYRKDKDGNVTLSYKASKLDVKDVRRDGENLIVERGSSTTKATANLREHINLPKEEETKVTQPKKPKNNDNKPDSTPSSENK